METLNNVSSTHEDVSPSPAQFVAQNPSEYTIVNTEMDNSNIHTQIAISIKPAEEVTPPNPSTAQFPIYTGVLYLVYAASLLYMFPSLIALVGLKFQNKAQSPFETHSFLANMAVVAYIFAIPMPVALYCLNARLASSARERFPPICYRILQGVFYFWSLLAPLSFVLVLFLPNGFDLIGYSFVFTLFVVVVACSFSNYICKKDASNLEPHKRNETWSHSALTITEE